MPRTTNTHSECAILIAFPLQQWLHERALMLRYTYIVGLFVITVMEFRTSQKGISTMAEKLSGA